MDIIKHQELMHEYRYHKTNSMEPNDIIDEQCGTIHKTVLGMLVFHCVHCCAKFTNLKKYQVHLQCAHYENQKIFYDIEECQSSRTSSRSIRPLSRSTRPTSKQSVNWEYALRMLDKKGYKRYGKRTKLKKQQISSEEVSINEDSSTESITAITKNLHSDKLSEQICELDAEEADMWEKELEDMQSWQESMLELHSNSSYEAANTVDKAGSIKVELEAAKPAKIAVPAVGNALAERQVAEAQLNKLRAKTAFLPQKPCEVEELLNDKEERLKVEMQCLDTFQEQKEILEIDIEEIKSEPDVDDDYEIQALDTENIEEHIKLENHYKDENYKAKSQSSDSLKTDEDLKQQPFDYRRKKNKDFPLLHQCHKCDKVFNKKSVLKTHMFSHAEIRQFGCHICGKKFKDKGNCTAHIRRHDGQRKYICKFCPKRFFSNNELAMHLRTHTGETPFICQICGQGFKRSGPLKSHVKRHENVREFECQQCDKAFVTKEELKGHMVGHSAVRSFACNICPSKFARRKTLVNHMKVHENAREYKCSHCVRAFNQRPAYTTHLKKIHGIVTKVGIWDPDIVD